MSCATEVRQSDERAWSLIDIRPRPDGFWLDAVEKVRGILLERNNRIIEVPACVIAQLLRLGTSCCAQRWLPAWGASMILPHAAPALDSEELRQGPGCLQPNEQTQLATDTAGWQRSPNHRRRRGLTPDM